MFKDLSREPSRDNHSSNEIAHKAVLARWAKHKKISPEIRINLVVFERHAASLPIVSVNRLHIFGFVFEGGLLWNGILPERNGILRELRRSNFEDGKSTGSY